MKYQQMQTIKTVKNADILKIEKYIKQKQDNKT